MHLAITLGVLVLTLSGCERAARPLRWTPPRVGERVTGSLMFRVTLDGPDGVAHTQAHTMTSTTEVLAVDHDRIVRLRATLDDDAAPTAPGAQAPPRGSFEIAETATGVEVAKQGGTPTEAERALLLGTWTDARSAEAGRAALAGRTFHVGTHLTPSADEAVSLGLRSVQTAELTVRELSATSVTFDVTAIVALPSFPDVLFHATGTLFTSDDERVLLQDGELRRGSTRLGQLHVEQRSRRDRPSTAAPR